MLLLFTFSSNSLLPSIFSIFLLSHPLNFSIPMSNIPSPAPQPQRKQRKEKKIQFFFPFNFSQGHQKSQNPFLFSQFPPKLFLTSGYPSLTPDSIPFVHATLLLRSYLLTPKHVWSPHHMSLSPNSTCMSRVEIISDHGGQKWRNKMPSWDLNQILIYQNMTEIKSFLCAFFLGMLKGSTTGITVGYLILELKYTLSLYVSL